MHNLFRNPPRRMTGTLTYPRMPYIKRIYHRSVTDVKAYYRRFPKRVDADNILGQLLFHIPRRWDLDDDRYRRFVEDMSSGVMRSFGITTPVNRGRVREGGVSLGPKTDEVLVGTFGTFDTKNAKRDWKNWSPFYYLYHTRVDLGMPIPSNITPGRGAGVSVIDIPMLALQYRYWLKTQDADSREQRESVFRFIGGYVLPNSLDSYLDIAVFNRIARISRDITNPKFPTPHPFYLPDYSRFIDQYGQWLTDTQSTRGSDLEQLPYRTGMVVNERLFDTMRLPRDPVTRQNDWAFQIGRLPYIQYIVDSAIASGSYDRTYVNELYFSLLESSNDNIFSGVGSSRVVKQYRSKIRELIETLENMGHG